MKQSLKREIKKIVQNGCANFFEEINGHKKFCVFLDDQCEFFKGGDKCKYFEEAVLPDFKELEIKYHEQRVEKKENKKLCKRCGVEFIPKSNRQLYCNNCKRNILAEQTKKRMKKIRNNWDVYVTL